MKQLIEIKKYMLLSDIKDRSDAICVLKNEFNVDTDNMTDEEVDDEIRGLLGIDFNVLEPVKFDYSKIIISEDTEFTETHKCSTPNGGAYTTAYYYDKNGNPCKRDDAWYMKIIEFTPEGDRINETYGIIRREEKL